MDFQTNFWNADINDLKTGYEFTENEGYTCLVCGQFFDAGQVFQAGEILVNAKRMVSIHIENEHGGMFDHLIGLHKNYTSLSDNQREVIKLMHQGLSDKEISKHLGIADSTIRSYRFKFKEKEKQAKAFLAIMDLLKNERPESRPLNDAILPPHKGAKQIDERYNITEDDVKRTIKSHLDEHGGLKTFPSKEKKKIIVLREIAKNFKEGKAYSEKEVNRILKRIYEDYALIRRYLIQYGFLDRKKDGSGYWLQ